MGTSRDEESRGLAVLKFMLLSLATPLPRGQGPQAMHDGLKRQLFSLVAALLCGLLSTGPSHAAPEDDLRAVQLFEKAVEARVARSPDEAAPELEKVRAEYARLVAQHPEHAPTRHAYATFLWETRRHDEAVAQWLEAFRLDPGNAETAYRLALAHLAGGRIAEADAMLTRAVQSAPDVALYHYDLATSSFLFRHQLGGDRPDALIARALTHYRRAVELAPFNAEYARGYAETFYAAPTPDWHEALRAWKHFLRITSDRNFAYRHLARVSTRLGLAEQARDYLNRIDTDSGRTPEEF